MSNLTFAVTQKRVMCAQNHTIIMNEHVTNQNVSFFKHFELIKNYQKKNKNMKRNLLKDCQNTYLKVIYRKKGKLKYIKL